jgi:hypothetical protein
MPGRDPTITYYNYSYRYTHMGCVAFCGKRYPFWEVCDTICYTLPQIISAIKKKIDSYDGTPEFNSVAKPLKEILRALNGTKVNAPGPYGGVWGELNVATWEVWQKHMESNNVVKDEIFLKEKSPVLAAFDSMVYINPNLRKLNFQTVMDPYTAYQELSMFLGNNMAQQVDPIPKMTDELKAHAHGYDKWSFRTHKEDSKKTKKRKAKRAKKGLELKLDDSDFK